ncbi:hypothetical protein CBR_g4171 [Chara braunii]|uniref:DDE Tnp4 domain-containing protein n=1 Tax=Chara braunii TaxID=69332 RepID=A0A388KHJ3_CHABU|nr:hypothetical protein CBR_g4171 [Chara braunii]|eukprot:GBG69477.1 hypothetical protein CBR_g4171 [Chara braunii]
MDGGGCGHGLRAEEMEEVAMVVCTVVLKTMNEMSSSSRDVAKQLRKRRALLQSVAEAADCVVTCEAVVQLCTTLSSGVFPRQTPRWWIKRRTSRTWEDLRQCDDTTNEYFRQKLRMSMAMFKQIVAALAAFVEKKVTHYRTPLPAEQVIAFTLYRWASRETYESGTSAFGNGRASGLQAVHDVTSALLRAYLDAIKWPILDVHVGYPGSVHDVCVLHNSQLWRRAQTGELFEAAPENLPHGVVTRGYLLGDNGYPVACPWIVQPYGGMDQGPDKEPFDNRQKVARGCVERAFGRLKCMWRLFLRTHKTNLETLPQQFVAVCTLHNTLLDAGIDFDENLLWEVGSDGVRGRVDLGIAGGDGGGRPLSSNIEGELLWNALHDRLALI